MKLVCVDWVDSSHWESGWHKVAEFDDRALMCHSVGWLVLNGKHIVTVAPHISDSTKEYGGLMSIPRKAILRIRTLR